MPIIKAKLYVNGNNGMPPLVNLKQFDKAADANGKQLQFTLYDGSAAYPIPSGSIVTIRGTKPDLTGYEYECSFTGSVVTTNVHEQMTVCAGRHNAEIRITKDKNILGTANVTLNVERSALSDATPVSETDLPLIEKAAEAYDKVNGKVTEASSYADEAKKQATNAKTYADSITTHEANAKKYAENASASAEKAKEFADSTEQYETRLSTVEKQIANTNLKNIDLDNILLDVDAGLGASKYPVGTQIVTDWDRLDASGNKTSYKPEWNIVHYENVSIKDSEEGEERNANVMYLEWDKTIPDGIAFCIGQSLQLFDGTEGTPNGLPAGTYCIKMKAPNGGSTFKTRWNGKYAKFTLSKAIPSSGTMKLAVSDWNGTSDAAVALHVQTFDANDTRIEEIVVTSSLDTQPSDATFLGETWGEDVGYGKLNHPESCYYGDSNWATSDLRQWLNGDGKDWWKRLTRYNRKPSVANTLQGFLTGLDPDLKKHLKLIKNTVIGNNQKYPNQKFVTYDKVFLHSFNQNNITTDYSSQFDNEGLRWDYYKQLANGVSNLDSQGRFRIWQTYPILIRYAINAPTSAQYVFSRSAYLSYAYYVRYVHASGYCTHANAYNGDRCLPACVIAKSQS